MARAVEKITLSVGCDIAFDKLVLGDQNVRRMKAGGPIQNLSEDIALRIADQPECSPAGVISML
ncbi:hypothetical protein [Rhizobium sp. Nf11,1]|uniref:hypothetical protein n=1 Tax=Rhizobium sp. Nf11,1 TaxID=3404923 RepID=UPI003D34961D